MPESVRRLVDALVSLVKPTTSYLVSRTRRFEKSHDYVALGKAMAEDRKDIHENQDIDGLLHDY